MKTGSAFEHLVIGIGEVGTAVASILGCDGIDKGETAPHRSYKFLHICFPYSNEFIRRVKSYQLQYSPDYTIIHSTTKAGTARACDAVSSVVRGKHPNLEEGIRTFVKYFGGENAFICAEVFKEKGIKVRITPNSDEVEAGKLYDTLIYGINILLEKEIHQYCEDNDLDFDLVYTDFNETYNEGYEALGFPQYKKYILEHIEGPINGHCVLQNAELLDTPFAKLLCKNTKN